MRSEDHREERADPAGGVEPEGREGAENQKLAVGEVHDPRDPVLQIEAHRDQRVGARKQKPRDDDVEH